MKDACLIELIIVVLTIHWLLSFFGQAIAPGVFHKGYFINILSVVFVILIIIRFFSYVQYQ